MSNSADRPAASGSMGEQAQEAAENFANAASECCSAWTDQLKQFTESTEEYVRKKPIQSLAIAAGIGLLIGLVVRR